jgi:phosphoglycerate dehydrogenase-like enzyme
MISKVTSFLPLKRLQEADIELPEGLDFRLVEASTEDQVVDLCRGADFLFLAVGYPQITRRVLENIPSVRMIQISGAGYDKVDVESAAGLGIPVANSGGENAMAVAEFTIALLVILQRHIVLADREMKAGNYSAVREQFFQSGLGEIRDTRLGLIGLGAIGREVAKLARVLEAQVSYFDARRPGHEIEAGLQIKYMPLQDLLRSSDVISLHVALTRQTKGLIGRQELRLMRPGSLLINTSRGEVVDQADLAEALENGHLEGAAIDTVSPEPPPSEHPLLNLSPRARDRLLITPHIAGITRGALNRMVREALANLVRVAAGDAPRHVVNGVPRAREPQAIG